MGWQIRGGPACAKIVNPRRTATMLIVKREKACEFSFGSLQCSDLTHVSRDAGGKETVNKLAHFSDKTEV